MENFTPIASLIGGILIGLSAAALMFFNGRVAGISGIFSGVLMPRTKDAAWKVFFIGGLVVGGIAMLAVQPHAFEFAIDRSLIALAVAGLLVGIGTQLGSGCTSGHGVCGLSRFSKRSLAATLTFMATGAITVYVINHVLGGAL
ncbi:MAG: YeeE/YedE family protein [Bradymonadaceae bacterium]